jgi:hypothetical protein
MTMSTLVIAINDPPTFDRKSSEIAHLLKILDHLKTEIGRGRGTVTSGSILGMSAAGVANTMLGSWTYTPSATKP